MDNEGAKPSENERKFSAESRKPQSIADELSGIHRLAFSVAEKISAPDSIDGATSNTEHGINHIAEDVKELVNSYNQLSKRLVDPQGEILTELDDIDIENSAPFGSSSRDKSRAEQYIQKMVQAVAIKDLKRVTSQLKEKYPDHADAIIQSGIEGDIEERDNFRKGIADAMFQSEPLIDEGTIFRYRSEIWHAVKKSPALASLFSEEIREFDREMKNILINTAFKKGAMSEKAAFLLSFYELSDHDVQNSIKNIFSASLKGSERATHILEQYKQRSDWKEILARAENEDPSLTFLIHVPERLSALFENNATSTKNIILENIDNVLSDETSFENLERAEAMSVLKLYVTRLISGNTQTDKERSEVLHTLTDEVNLVKTNTTEFFTLLGPEGPLYTNRELILQDVFKDSNFLGQAQIITDIFTKEIPYWQKLLWYTELRVGKAFETVKSRFPVEIIPKVSGDNENMLDYNRPLDFTVQSVDEMTSDQKKEVIDSTVVTLGDSDLINLKQIPYAWLKIEYRKTVFAHLLSETIRRSNSMEYKEEANRRNRANVQNRLHLTPDMYIHAASADILDNMLLNGNLPGEAVGEEAKTDDVPFHVDFIAPTQNSIDAQDDLEAILDNTLANKYGIYGKYGAEGQLFHLYDRKGTTWQDKRYMGNFTDDHYLILGGMPSTETSGIVLRSPKDTLEETKIKIRANGFYIPIYDIKGNLLFTSQDYDRLGPN